MIRLAQEFITPMQKLPRYLIKNQPILLHQLQFVPLNSKMDFKLQIFYYKNLKMRQCNWQKLNKRLLILKIKIYKKKHL